MGKVLSVTGHRPDKIGGYAPTGLTNRDTPIYKYIREKVSQVVGDFIQNGYDTFIQGMANGVDREVFAEVVLEYKAQYPHIKLVAAIPFKGQHLRWLPLVQKHYFDILAKCDQVVYVSDPIVNPADIDEVKKKMHARNVWMVENSDDLLAVWAGSKGGTGGCVFYAQTRSNKKPKIHFINPKWFE